MKGYKQHKYGYHFQDFFIPVGMMGGLFRWIENGIVPGGFLKAVICNDLAEAVLRADDHNIRNLPAYVSFFHNEAPSNCYGSKASMEQWKMLGGLEGIEETYQKSEAAKLTLAQAGLEQKP